MSRFPFDASNYNPHDPWHFPPGRLLQFAADLRAHCKTYRDRYISRHKFPDQRFVIFQELYGLSVQADIQAVTYVKTHYQRDWWDTVPELSIKNDRAITDSINSGLRDSLAFSYFSRAARLIVDAIFQTAVTLNDQLERETPENRKRAVYEFLELNAMGDFRPLLFISEAFAVYLRYGKYCPYPEQNVIIEYAGRKFVFQMMQDVKADEWGFLDNLDFMKFCTDESLRMLDMLFRKPEISALPLIRTRHLL